MRYYMAPLEEVTGYVFRNAYHAYFYPFDKYFAPFVAAKEQKGRLFNYKERNDILPENNRGIMLIPQILTNNSEAFIRTARGMREYGYEEINLNLGCPISPERRINSTSSLTEIFTSSFSIRPPPFV